MADDPHGTDASHAAARFQADLYRCWSAARAVGPLALGTRGYLALPAFRRLAARRPADPAGAAGEGEASQPRLLFIRRLLERLDLLERRADQRLAAADAATLAAYVELPLAERLRRCVRVWVAGGWWPDVPDARRPLPAVRTPAPPRIALARRHLLHDLLALAPGARWPIPPAPALPSGSTRRSVAPTEGATERSALLGPLHWLGLIALVAPEGGEARAASPTTCLPTPALAALRAPDADLAEVHGRVVIQANYEIVAYPPHTAPALFTLESCAEPRGEERAARYTLTRRAFAGVRRMGWPAGAVAARLAALADTPLPPNVAVTLSDWDRQADRLALRRGVALLELADAALLDALLRDRQAVAWVARRLAPGAALIHERHSRDVRAWLLRHGELPALAGPPTEPAPGEVE